MLISCKCLNFIATSNNNQQKQVLQSKSESTMQQCLLPAATSAATIATADLKEKNATVAAAAMQQLSNDCNKFVATESSNNNSISKDNAGNDSFSLINILRKTFMQKYPRSFIFYSPCVEFFKQAIGPVSDLAINVLNQKDLIYSIILDQSEMEASSEVRPSWQLSICSNCNVALCAKRLNANTPQFLINCGLLTNNEELSQKRADKSFSDTFGILIMDHAKLAVASNSQNQNAGTNSTIGALSSSFAISSATSQHLDSKQLRLRQLHANLQQRLQKEIAEADERIHRYTSHQFALLKSFREKSEQEYQMLVSLIQSIPDQQANEWLERQPPALDVSSNGGNLSYGGTRRRNTICNRRELSNTATTPTTPTSTQSTNNIFFINKENFSKNPEAATLNSPINVIMTASINTEHLPIAPIAGTSSSITPTVVGSALNRKMSNFDTPPATPEATPMSVGNSPTFRQQQTIATFSSQQQTFQQDFLAPIETADDCLFELEGVDNSNLVTSQDQQQNNIMYLQNLQSPLRLLQSQTVPHQMLSSCNRHSLRYVNAYQENQMSDLDESDDAEEAEDALDLDTSMPIATPHKRTNSKSTAQVGNIAKSLPIEISNPPLNVGRDYIATLESEEDKLDNNVDIAASIKALAKSVHGEAVFGDLPRPRLRSQI